MSSLETNLNTPPYFDDFDEDKRFHRVLFRPSVALQARELTQLQSILQNQIERFGNHIFKDGSVVQGCSVEYITDLEYIGVEDQFIDDTDLSVDDPSLVGAIAVGQTSDVQALIVSTRSGFIRQNPGCLFIRYTKPGLNGQRAFTPGETIRLYGEDSSYVENIILSVVDAAPFVPYKSLVVDGIEAGNAANVVARAIISDVDTVNNTVTVNNVRRRFGAGNVLLVTSNNNVNAAILTVNYDMSNEIGSIRTLTPYTDGIPVADNDRAGFAYGAHVSDGIVYHKGNFIKVVPHNVIVNAKSANPAGYLLGFQTAEEIVTETADESLNDNALGYPNANAPGAHRLKLTSTVVSKAANAVSNTDIFFPIVEFSNTGAVFERTDPEYAALGDAIAQRTYEESGHYVIKPFTVSSNTDAQDSNTLIYDTSPGLAYVKGERTELLTNLPVKGRRGTDTVSYNEQIVSTNYGNYVEVNELRGRFFVNGQSVILRPTAQQAVTTNKTTTNSVGGAAAIGTATFQELVHVSGVKGAANAVYRMYLSNIRMSTGTSFSSVRAITVAQSGNNFCDTVLTAGSPTVKESSYAPMLFDLGAPAVKTLKNANNVADTNYYYQTSNASVSVEGSGTVNFRVPSGGGILGFTDGSDNSKSKVSLMLNANALSSNLTTTATTYANGVIAATGLGAQFFPGEAVRIGSNTYPVTAVLSNDQVQVSGTVVASVNQTVQRYHYGGSVVALDGSLRTLTVNANNEATISLGTTYVSAPISATVRMYCLQNQGAEIKKEVKRSTVVVINVANTGSDVGPWNLGVPDVFKVRGVYPALASGNGYSADTNTNYLGDFVLDNGQRDSFYDHAALNLSPQLTAAMVQGKSYVVEFDHFVANNTTGKGFFSVDSYPVNDSLTANTASTIKTREIPTFFSSSRDKTFDLRNTIDFRSFKTATANITNSVASATVNPAIGNAFNAATTGFVPYPGQNFECNFTHYLPRKDVLTITPAGQFVVVEGVPGLNPRTPKFPAESLAIANIDVPAFPSLTDNERADTGRTEAIKISLQNNKRFTMKDISAIEQRVSRLEYYTSLNALEKSAADMKVIGTGGLDRFKNGIFVDALNDHSFGRVDHPEYRVAVDEKNGFARPFFQPEFFDLEFDAAASTGAIKSGDAVTMSYVEEAFITQDYATDSRSLSGAPPSYNGTLVLTPNRWSDVEVLANPVSVNTTDKASAALRDMSAPVLCAQYGWWRTDKGINDLSDAVDTAVESLRSKTNIGTESSYTVDGGTQQSVTVQPFIRAREIAFQAYGLKPYTKFYAYIDDASASDLFAPGDLANAAATDDTAVTRTHMWGTALESNSRGELEGKITVPGFRYKAGRHTVKLLSQGIDAITNEQVSSAAAIFEGEVIYKEPPPPIVIIVDVKPEPKAGPTAKFNKSGEAYVTAPANHSYSFSDATVKGSGTITTWVWSFGDGTTFNGQTPPVKTFNVTNSSQEFVVALTVTDSNNLTATYQETITLFKLQPAPPPAPPPPPAPSATLYVQSYANGSPTGSGETTGVGNSDSAHVATPSTTYSGAYFEWIVSVNSGSAMTNISVTSNGGVDGQANNRLGMNLFGPNYAQALNSAMTVTCRYKYANGYIIGSSSYNFKHNTTVVVSTPPPTSGGYKPIGGGGCVQVDQLMADGLRAGDVKVGMKYISIVPGQKPKLTPVEEAPNPFFRDCVRIVTEGGASLIVSARTQFNLPGALEDLEEGHWRHAADMLGELVLVENDEGQRWEVVTRVDDVGSMEVIPLGFGGRTFAAGEKKGLRIYSHNAMVASHKM